MLNVRFIAALLAVTALAGCVKDDPSGAADLDSPELFTLRGVVVDAAITPIADVIVRLVGGTNTSTGADGTFAFSGVEAGSYRLQFEKPGYIEQEVTHTLGSGAPTVTLERIPTNLPFAVAMEWTGFMSCSFYIATLFGTGCLLGDAVEDGSRTFDMIDRVPDFLQSEMAWEHTQPAGTNLCLRHYASSGIGGDILADDACGPSPLTVPVDADALQSNGIGNTRGLERVTWVDHWLAEGTAGLAIDQGFTVYTHLTYNFVPSAGWTFLVDGAPAP